MQFRDTYKTEVYKNAEIKEIKELPGEYYQETASTLIKTQTIELKTLRGTRRKISLYGQKSHQKCNNITRKIQNI